MKQCMAGIAFVLVALLAFAPAVSAQTKSVRGTIVSVAGDTMVVKVAGQDMTFKIDKATELTARGAGTAQKAAEAKGAPGVKLGDFAKAGQGVEVEYVDEAGVLKAKSVHSGLAPAEGSMPSEKTGGSVTGAITAISGASVTVKSGDKLETFAVDPKTTILGSGLGTITKKFKDEGKSPTITDLLSVNDQVVVSFKDEAGTKRAHEIRVTQKVAK
jgi:hypothetical protein